MKDKETKELSSLQNSPINNPFEETNKYRLEQSVLSPNLFHVASTSTPERETFNSLWNIDQQAVLYPADIPTDESSLIAQYIHDNLTRNVIHFKKLLFSFPYFFKFHR